MESTDLNRKGEKEEEELEEAEAKARILYLQNVLDETKRKKKGNETEENTKRNKRKNETKPNINKKPKRKDVLAEVKIYNDKVGNRRSSFYIHSAKNGKSKDFAPSLFLSCSPEPAPPPHRLRRRVLVTWQRANEALIRNAMARL